jgi:predicted ribosome quality control (RQC) complex YloA/Tae2 family protein
MKIALDARKSAQENAAMHFQRAKELARKAKGASEAIAETQKELDAEEKKLGAAKEESRSSVPEMRRQKEWFEKFKWFFTSGGRLVAAGRDAKQNDLLVAKVMGDEDLFFHADIQGAPATILVGGRQASAQEKSEAAQFAASHSSAWKVGAAAVDVYAVSKPQLSKHAQGGFVGAGGFAIKGEREWFRQTPLGLAIAGATGMPTCIPLAHPDSAGAKAWLYPGREEKGKVASGIALLLSCRVDEVLLALPSGGFLLKKRGV